MASEDTKMEEKSQYTPPTITPASKQEIDKLTQQMQTLYSYNAQAGQAMVKKDGYISFCPTPEQFLEKLGERKFNTTKTGLGEMLNEQECAKAFAYSNPGDDIVLCDDSNSFISAAVTAWSQHYPFRMKPEHIWLLILQNVAVHVDENAEKLRDKYVKHEGKKKLVVQISPNPDGQEWANTINSFAEQIDKNTVEDTVKLFDCDFSTSTVTEKIATKVTVMDICKNYFDYSCQTDCGFPQITLEGTQSDWVRLKEKAITLLETKVEKEFGKKWRHALESVLDRFIVAFDGNIDCVFWNSMIKRGSIYGSGAYSWFTGWFNVLFPYINKRWNRFCEPYSMERAYVAQGLSDDGHSCENDTADYPKGLATAPVEWDNNGKIIKLKFMAGFIGYKQDQKTLELTPNVGWCVAYEMNAQEIEAKRKKEQEEDDW